MVGVSTFAYSAQPLTCSGSLFRINLPSTVSTIITFQGNSGFGSYSGELTLASDGSIFGGLVNGGLNGFGSLFKIAPNSNINPDGKFSSLYQFTGGVADGGRPCFPLVLSLDQNFLFGVTEVGGASNTGIIFKISVTGTGLVKISDFDSASSGPTMKPGLTRLGSTIYGINPYSAFGFVYSISSTSTFSNLASFDSQIQPAVPLTAAVSLNSLFGVSIAGGANGFGSIFKFSIASNSISIIFSFSRSDGAQPLSALAIFGDSLFGSTYKGGDFDRGTVFRYSLTSNSLTSIYSFTGSVGSYPIGSLQLGSDNYFYGTASGDGGIIYRVSTGSDSKLFILFEFPLDRASYPTNSLALPDGQTIAGGSLSSSVYSSSGIFYFNYSGLTSNYSIGTRINQNYSSSSTGAGIKISSTASSNSAGTTGSATSLASSSASNAVKSSFSSSKFSTSTFSSSSSTFNLFSSSSPSSMNPPINSPSDSLTSSTVSGISDPVFFALIGGLIMLSIILIIFLFYLWWNRRNSTTGGYSSAIPLSHNRATTQIMENPAAKMQFSQF